MKIQYTPWNIVPCSLYCVRSHVLMLAQSEDCLHMLQNNQWIVNHVLYTDVFSNKILSQLITVRVLQMKSSWPLVAFCDLHSTRFHLLETELFYESVRSYSTMHLHVLLLGNSPDSNSSSSTIRPETQFIPIPRLSFCAAKIGIKHLFLE